LHTPVAAIAHSRFWHIGDMADALANVCYRGEDRTWDAPAAMSQFDPQETWPAPDFSQRKSIVRPSLKRDILRA